MIVIVPLPDDDGVPEICRLLLEKLTPEGKPLALYVGVGVPLAAGTVKAEMALLIVHDRALPPLDGKEGAVAAAATDQA